MFKCCSILLPISIRNTPFGMHSASKKKQGDRITSKHKN